MVKGVFEIIGQANVSTGCGRRWCAHGCTSSFSTDTFCTRPARLFGSWSCSRSRSGALHGAPRHFGHQSGVEVE